MALGFSGYFEGLFKTPVVYTSIVLIILLSILNLFGIEESSRLNVMFTLIEAAGLIIVVMVGLPYLGRVNYIETAQGLQGVLRASTLIFFAYLGFQDIVNLAEESKSPKRDIPRALILSVIITAIFYVFVSIALVSLVDWRDLGVSGSPLADAVSVALGQNSSLIMSTIALFATANTVLILLIVTSRMIYGMAKGGYLPTGLSKISERGSPWVAVFIVMGLSSGFVLLGNIEFVAEITNFGTFFTFAFVNLSAILLKIRKPELERPFQTPMIFGKLPIIPTLGLLSCGLMAIQFRLDIIVLSTIVIIIGVITQKILKKIYSSGHEQP